MRISTKLVGVLVTTSFSAFGQPPDDLLKDIQAAVVGDVQSGTSMESGMTVNVTARLRVRRVVLGSLAPGAEIGLAWSYEIRGMWPREDTASVRPVSGLWLLKQSSGGQWQPQPVTMNHPGAMGGVYLPATDAANSAEYYYPTSADPHSKVAMELGGAMAAVAMKEGDKLNPVVVSEGPGYASYTPTHAQTQFGEWMRWLGRLKPEAALPVYQRFSVSPAANLRAAGLSGLLKQGDAAALTALERDLPSIAPTLAGRSLGSDLNLYAFTKEVAPLQSLGRIVLAEQALPLVEMHAPHAFGASGKKEALPYLAAMLDHPDRDIRTSAVMSICTVLNARRNAEMAQRCPDRSPLRDPSQDPVLVQYWKAWWADQPSSKGAVRPPDRYRMTLAAAPPAPHLFTLEERFQMQALMYCFSEKRRKEHPDQAASRPFPEAPLSSEDVAIAARASLMVGRAEDEMQAAVVELKQRLRMQGQPFQLAAWERLAATVRETSRQGLDQLRRELSSDGWRAVERALKEMDLR